MRGTRPKGKLVCINSHTSSIHTCSFWQQGKVSIESLGTTCILHHMTCTTGIVHVTQHAYAEVRSGLSLSSTYFSLGSMRGLLLVLSKYVDTSLDHTLSS